MKGTMKVSAPKAALALCAILAAVSAARAQSSAPITPGPRSVTRIEYADGMALVGTGNAVALQAIKGSIHYPSGGTAASAVIVLLHGLHESCAYLGYKFIGSGLACPDTPLTEDVDSFAGYDYLAEHLASHGYVVLSADANDINTTDAALLLAGQDPGDYGMTARAQLVALSLDRLSRWNTNAGPGEVGSRLVGRVDLSRIGLMGHSRGAEGVTYFVDYNRTRPSFGLAGGPRYSGLKAVLSLAPTDFGARRPTGVAFATVLPYCDGDAFAQQGAAVFERSKYVDTNAAFPRLQLGVNGANHNWFNTKWASGASVFQLLGRPSDDADYYPFIAGDAACSTASPNNIRMTDQDQQRVGLALMASFLRRYVGNETAFDPLLTGRSALPAGSCPANPKIPCGVLTQASFIGAALVRRLILEPATSNPTSVAADGGAITAVGLASLTACRPSEVSSTDAGGVGCPTPITRSTTRQLAVTWDSPSLLRVQLLGPSANASAFRALTLRAGANYADGRNPAAETQDFDVALIDQAGREAVVAAASYALGALIPSRGDKQQELLLGGVRVPLSAFSGIDLSRLAALELRFGARTPRGAIQLADVNYQND